MQVRGATTPETGAQLIEKGCRQGALIRADVGMLFFTRSAESADWVPHYDGPANDTLLVVVSQDCDIYAPLKTEPLIEAMIARWTTDANEIHIARKGNSARLFALKDAGKRTLVADARRRVQLDKSALLLTEFETVLHNELSVLRFANWVAGRYNRPAIRNELVNSIQKPLVSAVALLAKSKNVDPVFDALSRIDELRFRASDSGPPWEVDLIALVDAENPPNAEQEAELGGWLESVLVEAENQAGQVARIALAIRTSATISLNDYLATTHLQLDHFTPDAS